MRPALARAIVVLLAVPALALPATSQASESLLSGYGGPGGGEQVILGAQLLEPPAGGGGGAAPSLRAAPLAAVAAARPPVVAAPARPTRSRTTPARRGRRHARHAPRRGAPPAAIATPRVVAYPTRASDAGRPPLSATDLLVTFIGLTALVFVGLGLLRLRTGNPSAAGPQAPAVGTDH